MKDTFSLVPTARGGNYLYFENQLYYKIKPKNKMTGITSYRCRRYHDENFRCKALLKASDEKVISLTNEHEKHELVKEAETLMLVAKKEIKNKVVSTKGPVKQIFDETLGGIISQFNLSLREAAEFAPKFKNIEKNLYRLKHLVEIQKDKLPKNLQEISFNEEFESFKYTIDKKRFLLFDFKNLDRIICFASDVQLEILQKSDRWHVDGTFKAAPTLFYQLYLIHGWYKDIYSSINTLKVLESSTGINYFQREAGGLTQFPRRPRDIQRDVMINYLRNKLEINEISILNYLNRMSNLFRYDKSNKKIRSVLPTSLNLNIPKAIEPMVSIFKISNQSFHFIKNYLKNNRDFLVSLVKSFRLNSGLCYFNSQIVDPNHLFSISPTLGDHLNFINYDFGTLKEY
ncbi:unnamed protein product [Brachionus calyciflorus]|uniref:FLYWCH-type domain-containing protein n=1 Tax=Brachionus calyciflorus TaxID=104777 RepID=A0A814J717_9BILA|nr:unnamed protein product [Brachionus calyciflorus]